jgi:hypothetical protein
MAAPGLLGLPIARDALRDLTKFDIRTLPRVAMLQQAETKRWVLSATDSGGCRPAMGHAVAFVALQSATKYRTQRIDTPYINSIHRTVVASALVRFEIFRMESTCDLLVSLHWIEPQGGNAKPSHRWQNLFNQQRGSLEVPLWEDSHLALRDVVMPKFFTRAAEEIKIPEFLHDGVVRITHAVCCTNCKHAHFYDASDIDIAIPRPGSSSAVKKAPSKAKQPKRKAEEPQNAAVVIEPAAAPLPLGDVEVGQLAL